MDLAEAAKQLGFSVAVTSPSLLAWGVVLAAGARLVRVNPMAGAALMGAALMQLVVTLVQVGIGPLQRVMLMSGDYASFEIELYFAAKYVVFGLLDVVPWTLMLVGVFIGRTPVPPDPTPAAAPQG